MKRSPIDRLLERSSAALATDPTPDATASKLLADQGARGQDLWRLLSLRNGFYGPHDGLLVRPLASLDAPRDLQAWNAPDGWVGTYEEDLSDALFFAEDVFGSQFALRDDAVWTFDPETGAFERLAADLQTWAWFLTEDDGSLYTGDVIAATWQERFGAIERGCRLRPTVPFVLGGQYDVETLRALPEDEIRFLAEVANQIRDLPDGAEVRIRWRGGQGRTR